MTAPREATGAAPVLRAALVTGATGLLGSNIVRELHAAGTEVVAVVRDPERAAGLLPPDGVRLVVGDVTDVAGIAPYLPGLDAVFHTAAYFREYYQPGVDLGLLRRTNVDAVRALLHASADAGVGAFVHTSSVGTLTPGTPDAPSGESATAPAADTGNHYFRSKIDADALVTAFEQQSDMRVATVLPAWMWGPGDAGPTAAGRLFLSIASGSMSAVPRAANWVVDARDVAAAAIRAAAVGRGRYVVAGVRRSLPEMAGEIAAAVGRTPPRAVPVRVALAATGLMELSARLRGRPPAATRSGVRVLMDGERRWLSSARAQAELGVALRGFDETARDVARWYREHRMLL